MSDVAIVVEKLSKQYRIGGNRRFHDTFSDTVMEGLAASGRRFRAFFSPNGSHRPERQPGAAAADPFKIWALKDVSFEVKQGEAIGIIGRNGAGKSTLLKILSRVTEPTGGYAGIRGRVGSLLEVGTGFHHELTGRENIFLSGAVLGMKKAEIGRKFDEIVDFAGVEKFIDTPVKRYSSGMYMRLAFAVAAHLEPEILIVDEVLAVGDMSFQKKCLGKMEGVANEGRTVVFVSHNMSAITRLCPEAILLDEGRVELSGPSPKVVEQYLTAGAQEGAERTWRPEELPKDCGPFRIASVRVCNEEGALAQTVRASQPFSIEVRYELTEAMRNLGVQVQLRTPQGDLLFISADVDDWANHGDHHLREPGRYASRCHIPGHLLNRGIYIVGISVAIPYVQRYFWDLHAVSFTVDETDSAGNQWALDRGGFFRPALKWEISKQ